MKLEYHKILDGVRGIAMLMVMIFYFSPVVDKGSILHIKKRNSYLGQAGVT